MYAWTHIPCPYCYRPSYLGWSVNRVDERRASVEHFCPSCGRRELPLKDALLGWARNESSRPGMIEELKEGEDGKMFGKATGRCFGRWGE